MWGNGAATASVFALQGCKIFGCDLNLPSAESTQRRIAAQGGDMTVIQADVTKIDQVKALVEATVQKYGRIDVLVKQVSPSPILPPLKPPIYPPQPSRLTLPHPTATSACPNLAPPPACPNPSGTRKWT